MNVKKASIFFLVVGLLIFVNLSIFVEKHQDYFSRESWNAMIVDKGSLKDSDGSNKYVLTLINDKYDRIERFVSQNEYSQVMVGQNYVFYTSGYLRNDKPWIIELIFGMFGLAIFSFLTAAFIWLKLGSKTKTK